jgi:cytochrome c-type biogenesis protein CcmE
MNTRARNRLIGVTVLILLIAAAVFFGSGGFAAAAYSKSVTEVTSDAKLVGQRVKVNGTVVAGSWNKKNNPMVFQIRAEGATGGPQILVTYSGVSPNTFGDGSAAIVTGTLENTGSIKADEMMVKCPTKYESRTDAVTVSGLFKAEAGGHPIKVLGLLAPGTLKDASASERFTLASALSGGDRVGVVFPGAMPDGAKDGVTLVVTGTLQNGKFLATDVSLSK